MTAAAALGPIKNVRQVLQRAIERDGFDKMVLGKMNILSADVGRIKGEILVEPHHANAAGGTHGGWLSTIVDVGGSLAIASHGFPSTGVSTDLSVSFLSASGPGHSLTFDAQVLKLGRTLAYTRVDIFSNDKIVATGNHTKFIAKVPRDGEIKS